MFSARWSSWFPFTGSGSLFKLLKGLLWRRRHKFLCNARRRGSLRSRSLFSPDPDHLSPRTLLPAMKCSPYFIGLTDVIRRCLKHKGGRWREQSSDSSANESAGMELTSRGGQSFMKWFIWILSVCWSIMRTLWRRKSMFWCCTPVYSSLSALCGTTVFDPYR